MALLTAIRWEQVFIGGLGMAKTVSVDTKAGSLAYNRFEMQVSQTLHMAIELYSDLNYLYWTITMTLPCLMMTYLQKRSATTR